MGSLMASVMLETPRLMVSTRSSTSGREEALFDSTASRMRSATSKAVSTSAMGRSTQNSSPP